MSAQHPVHVILVPGDDGRVFTEDIARAQSGGVVTHAMSLPGFQGHRIDGRPPYYDRVAGLIHADVRAISRTTEDARILGIGRNHGGSLLAYAAARSDVFHGLVLTGAIPELSTFYASSDHESARRIRASLGGASEVARFLSQRDLDLVASVGHLRPDRCLIQVGTLDPWMDEAALNVFRALQRDYRVEWLPDDHAMASEAAVTQRWAFLTPLAKPVP